MKKVYDLSVKTSTTKEGKAVWTKVGVCMQNDKGMFLLLDKTFNPAGIQDGKSSCMISMFEPKPYVKTPAQELGFDDSQATFNTFDNTEELPF